MDNRDDALQSLAGGVMGRASKITVEIGIPKGGLSSVFSLKLTRQDSAGEVTTSYMKEDRAMVTLALLSLLMRINE